MEIRLHVDQLQPPAGRVTRVETSLPETTEGAERSHVHERSFTGWLELLALLSELMGAPAERP
jgi:hypothetical protein